jgi:glycosyltransferase involved in cell wall biosynthesis
MRVLMWHVHGSYMTNLLAGGHEVLIPVLPDRGPDGRGRARTWDWPANAVEVTPGEAAGAEVDAVVLQRPVELEGLARRWLGGREPGRDLPAIYLEHDAPRDQAATSRHPAADRPDLLLVHVTHFNALMWDSGCTPTRVVEHGVVDPGPLYTGELPRAIVVCNELRRRGRVVGFDLLPRLGEAIPLDVAGIGAGEIGGLEDLRQSELHAEMARRRVYLHPVRWTSLGLTLIEAMHIGMPVAALATTEVAEAVPRDAGIVTNDLDRLTEGLRELVADARGARAAGEAARAAALERFSLARFLRDWDAVLEEAVSA